MVAETDFLLLNSILTPYPVKECPRFQLAEPARTGFEQSRIRVLPFIARDPLIDTGASRAIWQPQPGDPSVIVHMPRTSCSGRTELAATSPTRAPIWPPTLAPRILRAPRLAPFPTLLATASPKSAPRGGMGGGPPARLMLHCAAGAAASCMALSPAGWSTGSVEAASAKTVAVGSCSCEAAAASTSSLAGCDVCGEVD